MKVYIQDYVSDNSKGYQSEYPIIKALYFTGLDNGQLYTVVYSDNDLELCVVYNEKIYNYKSSNESSISKL